MSSIAVTCGLIILVLLVIMLLAGVPIAVALAVSSIAAILPVFKYRRSRTHRRTEDFLRYFRIQLAGDPFLYSCRKPDEQGRYRDPSDQLAKLFTGRIPGALAHTNAVANMLFGAISGSWYSSSFRYGFYYRTY